MKSKSCSRYIKDLKHLFPVYGKKQKIYLNTIKASINDYYDSSMPPSYEDLIDHFGSPQEIIGDYIREQDTQDLLKQVNQKRHLQGIVYILFISALVCSFSYGINCYRAYLHCIQSEPAYYYEKITTDSSSIN